MPEFSRVLTDGLRSLALLKPRPDAFAAPLSVHLATYLLYLLVLAAFESAVTDPPRTFNAGGVSAALAAICVAIGLLSLLPLRRAGASPERIMLGSVAASLPLIAFVTAAIYVFRPLADRQLEDIATGGELAHLVAFLIVIGWSVLLSFRLIYGMVSRWRIPLALSGIVLLLVSSFILPNMPMLRGKNDPAFDVSLLQMAADAIRPTVASTPAKPPNERPPIDGEAVMMGQHALVAETVAAIKPARDAESELYFVGFAPYSWQDVFKREVTAVKALFDERFGTAGRSIILQNHRDSITSIPLASVSNLATVLGEIGRRMQPERDVLVLFVTSHGDEERIAVSMEGVRLNNLTPVRLLNALDQAGIKNRVLILSACYSGSFVKTLSDENTMILTAARADRTSFGCSNEREWTFFGDAYFNHALRQERSFVTAFERARGLVETWEKEQGLTGSDPQIFVGSAIRQRVDTLLASRLLRGE